MTLTTPQCPASGLIFEQVHNRLAGIPDISKVEVDLVWEPRWTPHRISDVAASGWEFRRSRLGRFQHRDTHMDLCARSRF